MQGVTLTDQQIDAVFEQMTDGAVGFLKSWGYRNFARQIIAMVQPLEQQQEPSPTAGMSIAQRIAHVGGRNNDAGYVEFGSIQAVEALVRQVLRDLPAAPAGLCQITEPAGQSEMDAWREGAKFALRAVSEVDSLCWLTDDMRVVCIKLAGEAVIAERERQRAALETKQGDKP